VRGRVRAEQQQRRYERERGGCECDFDLECRQEAIRRDGKRERTETASRPVRASSGFCL
jgi:hypothetical protein